MKKVVILIRQNFAITIPKTPILGNRITSVYTIPKHRNKQKVQTHSQKCPDLLGQI